MKSTITYIKNLSSTQKLSLLLILSFSLLIIPISVWAALNRSADTRSRGYTATPISPPYIEPFNPDIDRDGDVDFLDYHFYANIWDHSLFNLAKIAHSFTSFITPTPVEYELGRYYDTFMYSTNNIMPQAIGSIISEIQSKPANQYYWDVSVRGQVYNLKPYDNYQLIYCSYYNCYSANNLRAYSDSNGTAYFYGHFKYFDYQSDRLNSIYLVQANSFVELQSLNQANADDELIKLENIDLDLAAITPFPTPTPTIKPRYSPTPAPTRFITPTFPPSRYPTPTPKPISLPTSTPTPYPETYYGSCYSLKTPCAQGWIYDYGLYAEPIEESEINNDDIEIEPQMMKKRHDGA